MAREVVIGACPHDCPDTCSILTTVEDGKAIAVRGNPDHPFTKGRLCVKVNDYQNRVYSDQRVLYPMKRVGPKGSPSREPYHPSVCSRVVEACMASASSAVTKSGPRYDPPDHRIAGHDRTVKFRRK